MTADEFRAHLTRLGYTQAGFGKAVDVGERTVRRWATDDSAQIPKAIQMLLEGKTLKARRKALTPDNGE